MMRELLISLFGTYTPVMTTESFVVSGVDGNVLETVEVVASGFAGVDWPWVLGVLLFALVLYSFFRLVGVFLK
jgi:hypothetical protein